MLKKKKETNKQKYAAFSLTSCNISFINKDGHYQDIIHGKNICIQILIQILKKEKKDPDLSMQE